MWQMRRDVIWMSYSLLACLLLLLLLTLESDFFIAAELCPLWFDERRDDESDCGFRRPTVSDTRPINVWIIKYVFHQSMRTDGLISIRATTSGILWQLVFNSLNWLNISLKEKDWEHSRRLDEHIHTHTDTHRHRERERERHTDRFTEREREREKEEEILFYKPLEVLQLFLVWHFSSLHH